MIMLDESIGDTICALEAAGIQDRTLMVVASDNEGFATEFQGASYPFRGGTGPIQDLRQGRAGPGRAKARLYFTEAWKPRAGPGRAFG